MSAKQMSQEEFAEKVFNKHGNKVEIVGSYIGAENPVEIKCYCEEHGWTTKTLNAKNIFPKSFTLCSKCSNSNKSKPVRSSEALEKLRKYCESNGGKLLSPKWTKGKDLYEVKCGNTDHPPFKNSADKLLNSGQWCPYCCGRKGNFEDEIKEIIHMKNGELMSDYTNSGTHVTVKCKTHNFEWEIFPFNIKKGRWCPICSMVYSEKVVYDYLINKNIKCIPQVKLDNSLGEDGVPYRFDFGVLDSNENVVAIIEVDGEHHRRDAVSISRDEIKDAFCESLGIEMFRLIDSKATDKRFRDYDWYYEYIDEKLKDFIKKYQFER